MKGLSLKQPWLYLICKGIKTIETRTWLTHYRGDILLCASKVPTIMDYTFYNYYKIDKNSPLLKDGMALAVATLKDVTIMTNNDVKKACCDLYNAYSWHLENVRLIEPFPIKGGQKLFNLNPEIQQNIIYK